MAGSRSRTENEHLVKTESKGERTMTPGIVSGLRNQCETAIVKMLT